MSETWDDLAARISSRPENQGNDPLSIMARASWEYSVLAPEVAQSDEEWSELIRSDIRAQIAGLERAGYQIVRAPPLSGDIEGR